MLIKTSRLNENELEKMINQTGFDISKPIDFIVLEAEYRYSQNGNPMIELLMGCFQGEFNCEPTKLKRMYDKLMLDSSNKFQQLKLIKFLSSIGMREEYLSGQFDSDNIKPNLSINSYRIGSCMVKEEDALTKDNKPYKKFTPIEYLYDAEADNNDKDIPFNDDINF